MTGDVDGSGGAVPERLGPLLAERLALRTALQELEKKMHALEACILQEWPEGGSALPLELPAEPGASWTIQDVMRVTRCTKGQVMQLLRAYEALTETWVGRDPRRRRAYVLNAAEFGLLCRLIADWRDAPEGTGYRSVVEARLLIEGALRPFTASRQDASTFRILDVMLVTGCRLREVVELVQSFEAVTRRPLMRDAVWGQPVLPRRVFEVVCRAVVFWRCSDDVLSYRHGIVAALAEVDACQHTTGLPG